MLTGAGVLLLIFWGCLPAFIQVWGLLEACLCLFLHKQTWAANPMMVTIFS